MYRSGLVHGFQVGFSSWMRWLRVRPCAWGVWVRGGKAESEGAREEGEKEKVRQREREKGGRRRGGGGGRERETRGDMKIKGEQGTNDLGRK